MMKMSKGWVADKESEDSVKEWSERQDKNQN